MAILYREEVIVWNMADHTFREERRFPLHEHVSALSFSPNGRFLAICLWHSVLVQSVETGDCVGRPTAEVRKPAFTSIAYSPDGTLLVAAAGTTLVAWETSTYNEVIDPLHGHDDEICQICVSPDNKKIVSASRDSTLRMWDFDQFITPRSPVSQVSHEKPNPVTHFAFSPCGKKLASSTSSGIYVWDTATCDIPSTSTRPNFIISLFKLAKMTTFNSPELLAYSPDGRYLVGVRNHFNTIGGYDTVESKLEIWDTEMGKPSTAYHWASASLHHDFIHKIFFVPSDDRWLLAIGGTGWRMWEEDGSEVVIQVKFKLPWTHRVLAFSPDTSRVMVGVSSDISEPLKWEVWCTKATERRPIHPHDLPEELLTSQAFEGSFLPCGRLVEVHNWVGGPIYVLDAETGVLISRLISTRDRMTRVAFSPDSNFIASTHGLAIRIWNVRNGDLVRGPWDGHTKRLTHLTFSPDGSTLASSSSDGTIRLWDTSDLHERDQGSKPLGDLPDAFLIEDGWAMGESGELLFWVPPDLRTGLWRPRNTAVISPGLTAKLDYTSFKYGRDWAKCRDGQQSD
jgi:WD40 repeat protein